MSKLYPQWGSGKKPFKKVFKAATLKKIGQQHMSAGDKIIMPEKSFKEIKRLRLGFPFMFEFTEACHINKIVKTHRKYW